MPCCAFAVFLLLNLLAPFGWLRRSHAGGGQRSNAAVAWRHGQDVPRRPTGRRHWRWGRAMLGAVTVELLAVAALGAYWLARGPTAHAVEDWDVLIALHTSWCSSGARDGQPELSFAEQRP